MKILFRQKDGYTVILSGRVAVLIILHLFTIIGLWVRAVASYPDESWWILIMLLAVLFLPLWIHATQDEWHETG